MHAYLNQESDISHFITYYIRAFDGYDSQGEQIVRSMTWKPSENLTPKQIEKELQRQVIMFEETVKKGTCLTVTPAFQNMPKSGLKITSPRYLLLKDLAEAAELSVSTITEPIKRIIEIFGTVYLRTVSVTNTVQKIHIAVVAALAYLFTAMPGIPDIMHIYHPLHYSDF